VKVHIRPVKKFSVIETRQHNGQECLDSYRQFINGEGEHDETLAEVLCDLMHGCDKEFLNAGAYDYHRISFDGCLAEARRRYLAEIGLL
jgi:hypothetical protein